MNTRTDCNSTIMNITYKLIQPTSGMIATSHTHTHTLTQDILQLDDLTKQIKNLCPLVDKVHFNAKLQAAIDNVLSVRVTIEISHGDVRYHWNGCRVLLAGVLPRDLLRSSEVV